MPGSMVKGRLIQDAWNLLFFALAALSIAVAMNWQGSGLGFRVNFAVVSVADTGFVLFVVVPGYVKPWPGLLGPVFWIAGLGFTGWALLRGADQGIG